MTLETEPKAEAPQNRGFSLEFSSRITPASELYGFSDVLYAANSDVIINNPSFLGVVNKTVEGKDQTFLADIHRNVTEESGKQKVVYEWLLIEPSTPSRISYIELDSLSIKGAVEERNEGRGGHTMRWMDQDEIEDSPGLVRRVLAGLDFNSKADAYRDKRSEQRKKLGEVLLKPSLYNSYLGNNRSNRVPSDNELDWLQEREERKIESIGFPKTADYRFNEFRTFIANLG